MPPRTPPWIVWLTGAALVALCAASAWVGEDAHITFRTIDNFANGYGLRWNVDERVQTYTHPLWMLVNLLAYLVTHEVYFTTCALGLLFTGGAWALAARTVRGPTWVVLAGLFAPLALSRSFVRYATSGFENSLSYLLYALFAAVLLRAATRATPRWTALSVVTALAAVNRLDTLLLYLPALALLWWTHRGAVAWRAVALGTLPALAWYAFSTFYYGFPLPNTALAKLNAEISAADYIAHGLAYTGDLVARDPVTLALLGFAWLGTWVGIRRARRGAPLAERDALAIGVSLYSAYIVAVGGDFLTGRFWALPAFAAAIVWAVRLEVIAAAVRAASPARGLAVVAGLAAVVWILVTTAPGLERNSVERRILELPVARRTLGADLQWHDSPVAHNATLVARKARALAESSDEPQVTTGFAVGFTGFYSGPRITIIDFHALTDPLLARLPPAPTDAVHIGHFERHAPRGYLHARRTGDASRMEPALADYYRKLRLVTSGPLWSGERWRAIAALNLMGPPAASPGTGTPVRGR